MRFALLLLCFVASGAAGLVYQTAWTRQLGLVFGASELAVVAVLAAYMAGLTAGAAWAEKRLVDSPRPLWLYALLEAAIAATALAVPWGTALVARAHDTLLGGLDRLPEGVSLASTLFYLAGSFVVLLPPTLAMGATLPLLVRHAVEHDGQLGRRVGLLYGANTVGAAAGTLGAAFVLLPNLGLDQTIWVAAALNLLVFGAAALLARGVSMPVEPDRATGHEAFTIDRRTAWMLPAIFASGAVSFGWEVLWTRLLTHLLGGSVYAFATMLGTFLIALAIGGAIGGRLARDRGSARQLFVGAQLAAGALSVGAFVLSDRLVGLATRLTTTGIDPRLGSGLVAAAVLFPGALAIGATFPAAVRYLARDADDAASASARVLVWNTLGGALGAILVGIWLLPALRFAGVAELLGMVSLVLAVVAATRSAATTPEPASPDSATPDSATPEPTAAARDSSPASRGRRLLPIALAGAVLLALAIVQLPTPWTLLRTSALTGSPVAGEVIHYAVGRSATVLAVESEGAWRVLSNGLPESSILPPATRTHRFGIARWLSLLPMLERPTLDDLLIVGLGGGRTLEAAPPVEAITVVELEAEIVAANRHLAAARSSDTRPDPLADPRLHLVVNDARSALRRAERSFDAIVSQPSHPWTGGASHLFTRELFVQARERLRPDGVFVQWIGLRFIDAELTRTLLATLLDVFPHVEVFRPAPGGALLFAASNAPLDVRASAAQGLERAAAQAIDVGLRDALDVEIARILDTAGARALADGAPLSTDGRNLLQIRSPALLRQPPSNAWVDALVADHDPLHTLSPVDRRRAIGRLLAAGAGPRARALLITFEPNSRADRVARAQLDRDRDALDALLLRAETNDDASTDAARAVDPIALDARLRIGGAPSDALRAAAARIEPADLLLRSRALAAESPTAPSALDADLDRPAEGSLDPLLLLERIRWRVATRDPERAREALPWIDRLLPALPSTDLYLLRARLGQTLERSPRQGTEPALDGAAIFDGSLFEGAHLAATPSFRPGQRQRFAREALQLLERAPPSSRRAELRRWLEAQAAGRPRLAPPT